MVYLPELSLKMLINNHLLTLLGATQKVHEELLPLEAQIEHPRSDPYI
jgi:hypothetical protein